MATITPGAFTYAEWALRHDKDGKISTLVNMQSQANGVIDDMLTVECQSGNAFEYTQVVSLPTPSSRIYNLGVARTMAGVAKLTATCGQYADWVFMDKDLAELGGNLKELRATEVQLHMQGIGQKVASDLFYANRATSPATPFTGLANIYNTVSTTTSAIAKNVIDCNGTLSTNTSLWLINWGPKAIHAIFPKGTMAGLEHKDYGDLPAPDANSNEYPAYRDWLSWKIGLAIHDWRQAVRACNIDVAVLNSGSAANLITILAKMVHRLPVQPVGVGPVNTSDSVPDKIVMNRPVFYCDRTILEYLDLQAANKTNVLLRQVEWDGMVVNTYRGIPIRCVDAIVDTETRVV